MFDLIRFELMDNEKTDVYYYQVNKLPKNYFESSSDVVRARAIVKRVKYFHFQNYTAEQGLITKMKENDCTLVVALDDFFSISNEQIVRRLSRARNLVYIARKNRVDVKIFSLAKDKFGLRDAHEILYIGKLLGMEPEYVESMINKEEKL